MKKTLLTVSMFAALGTLTACGGGDSGGTTTTRKTVTGVVTARTVVPRLGAAASGDTITINGTTYAVDSSATVDSDDSASSLGTISEGDVVTVEASDDDGDGQWTATAVEYDDELQGYVLESNLIPDGAGGFTGTLNVMGMVVQVDSGTLYAQGDGSRATLDLLVAGDVVEVSGFADASGTIVATRIEGRNPAEDTEVKGVVSNITATTFDLGTLQVDFATLPADLSDLPGGLTDGLYVEVKADAAPTLVGGVYVLQATAVELQDGGDVESDLAADGEDMEVTGLLSVDGGGVMTLDGYTLVVSDSSTISAAQLAALAGQVVEVEGYMENGSLVVTDASIAN